MSLAAERDALLRHGVVRSPDHHRVIGNVNQIKPKNTARRIVRPIAGLFPPGHITCGPSLAWSNPVSYPHPALASLTGLLCDPDSYDYRPAQSLFLRNSTNSTHS